MMASIVISGIIPAAAVVVSVAIGECIFQAIKKKKTDREEAVDAAAIKVLSAPKRPVEGIKTVMNLSGGPRCVPCRLNLSILDDPMIDFFPLGAEKYSGLNAPKAHSDSESDSDSGFKSEDYGVTWGF